ncbi:hypothetical protein FE257_000760 [Aspergillus nanangensis]|uniref:Potassium channel domain-containing protein n=1 Tax=Aspergillus nanangensis TaxID=2582783 RepID=A0AAD4GPA7_ASPNN|nr:hypothetical protein FE257_000760 [Aspergillus nanangensis]
MASWKTTIKHVERRNSDSQGDDPGPQRWLFVTGFPVIAVGSIEPPYLFSRSDYEQGTLSVMAMMFNICALSGRWQEAVDIDGLIISLPRWIVVLPGVSLLIATPVYITYLLTMRRPDRQVTVFLVSVLGWIAAAAILFSAVGVAVQRHNSLPPPFRRQYTQAFYYGVFAAALYALVALLLALYVVGALRIRFDRHIRDRVQRTSILLRSLWLAIVLLAGAVIYRAVEGWSLLDALYFADFTILTIGIGNLVPTTHLGRSLLFPYATTGIIALGLVVSAVLSFTHDMRDMKLRLKMAQARGHWKKSASSSDQELPLPRNAQIRELHRIKVQFDRSMHYKELVFFLLAWLVLWFISAAVFRASERQQDWSYFVALYFTFTSLTTIGYGDFYPTSSLGKVFFVFWSLLALPILTNLVTAMGAVLHQVLVFCSASLWKHGTSLAHIVRMRCIPCHGEDKKSTQRLHPSPEIESLGQPTLPPSRSMEGDDISQSLHRLLIIEQMDWLVTTMRDGRCTEDLRVVWSRIVPLLHAGEQDIGSLEPSSSSPPHHFEQMTALLDPHRQVEDRNTVILWMLTFLIHQLHADLGTSAP